ERLGLPPYSFKCPDDVLEAILSILLKTELEWWPLYSRRLILKHKPRLLRQDFNMEQYGDILSLANGYLNDHHSRSSIESRSSSVCIKLRRSQHFRNISAITQTGIDSVYKRHDL